MISDFTLNHFYAFQIHNNLRQNSIPYINATLVIAQALR